MDNKQTDKVLMINNNINITERKNITINGITKIDSFDSEEFILETSLGPLGVKGRELEIIKLDTYDGTIIIKGIIDGFSYLDVNESQKKDSIIMRLFK